MKLKLIAGALALGILAGGNALTLKAEQQTPPTADQAKNNTSDRDTMQKIRKAVMDDKSLSTTAHNVKIISQNGKVTLKGQVTSDAEKTSIEQKATDVAGAGNVTDDITIKPAKN